MARGLVLLDAGIAFWAAEREPRPAAAVEGVWVGCLTERLCLNAWFAALLPQDSVAGGGGVVLVVDCFFAEALASRAALAPAELEFGSHDGAIL